MCQFVILFFRPRPVPVPRRRKNLKTEDDLRNLQYFQEPAGQNEQGRATSSVRSNFEVCKYNMLIFKISLNIQKFWSGKTPSACKFSLRV